MSLPNVAIYGALYGKYEDPKPLPELGASAFMLTDDPDLRAQGWTMVVDDEPNGPGHPLHSEQGADQLQKLLAWDTSATVPMMFHKYWKTHPHVLFDSYDITIWLDASMEVVDPAFVEFCVEALGEDDWVAVRHPWRDCIYDEGVYSGTLPRYDSVALDQQLAFYRDVVGHPAHWGLFATGAMVRRNTGVVRRVSENWWDECMTRSHQDQVSLPVLFRLQEDLKWNTNMPWETWWINHPHHRSLP